MLLSQTDSTTEILANQNQFKKNYLALARVAQLVGALAHEPKGHRSDPWSGNTREQSIMFLSHTDAPLLPSLSKQWKKKKKSSGEDIKKKIIWVYAIPISS